MGKKVTSEGGRPHSRAASVPRGKGLRLWGEAPKPPCEKERYKRMGNFTSQKRARLHIGLKLPQRKKCREPPKTREHKLEKKRDKDSVFDQGAAKNQKHKEKKRKKIKYAEKQRKRAERRRESRNHPLFPFRIRGI